MFPKAGAGNLRTAQVLVVKSLQTFAEFPRRAKPMTFRLEQVMHKIEQNATQ